MEALKLFQEYMGTGLIMIWFLVSLLYLWVTEKRKYIRILFVYVPLVLLLVFFNPVVAKIIHRTVPYSPSGCCVTSEYGPVERA